MQKLVFITILIALIICSCSANSELLISENAKTFWDMSKFYPDNISDIIGEYTYSNGHGGGTLKLNKDSSFYLNEWSSLRSPNEPFEGFIGKYSFKSDSLFLEITSLAVDTSQFIELHFYGIYKDNIGKAIQDSLNIKNNSYFKSIDSIKANWKHGQWSDRHNFFVKRIGESIFMVRFSQQYNFIDELKRNFNFPYLCRICKEKIFAFHFTKMK